MEEQIRNNTIVKEDITFRRYKALIIPIDGLLSLTCGLPMIEIIGYFLRNSTMKRVENTKVEEKHCCFPFKCIGLV